MSTSMPEIKKKAKLWNWISNIANLCFSFSLSAILSKYKAPIWMIASIYILYFATIITNLLYMLFKTIERYDRYKAQ